MICCKNDMKHETSYLQIKFCSCLRGLDTYFYQNFNMGAVNGDKTANIASIIYHLSRILVGRSLNEPLGVFLCLVLQWCFDIGVIDGFITNIYLWKICMSNMIICTLKCGGDEKRMTKCPLNLGFIYSVRLLGSPQSRTIWAFIFFNCPVWLKVLPLKLSGRGFLKTAEKARKENINFSTGKIFKPNLNLLLSSV